MFVLDTNVLLSDPNCLRSFQDNDIILPIVVLEELDKHKTRVDEVGVNARTIVRTLETLRAQGSLYKGVEIGPGFGTLRIGSVTKEAIKSLPFEYGVDKADNVILATVLSQVKRYPKRYVALVTRDVNLRLKADALDIPTEDYKNSKVTDESKGVYNGVVTLDVSNQNYELVCKGITPASKILEDNVVYPQQFLRLSMGGVPLETVRYISPDEPLARLSKLNAFNLKARNAEQDMALQLLLDPTVSLVTLTGNAGSGKTLLAVAAAFEQVINNSVYDRIIISRSAQPMGKDIGFLPGTLQEKMQPWVAPVLDSIAFLTNSAKKRREEKDGGRERESRERNTGDNITTGDPYIDLLFKKKVISIEALTYIRGRSIPRSILLIDETQNLSLHELKTIVTRIGEGSKLVLTGDLDQIDNTHVDQYSNGLTYAIERFKDCPFAGHVTLVKGERSALATYAAKVL